MAINEAMKTIGGRVRNGRIRAKLSQTELGHRAGYSLNVIAKIEQGKSEPKYSVLVKIADALGLSVVDLLVDGALVEKMIGQRVNLEIILSLTDRIIERFEKTSEAGKQTEDVTSQTLPDATRENLLRRRAS